MLNTFINWVTYNPNQISINTILPQIVIVYVVLVIMLCLFVAIFKRISVKTVILSLLYTPYLMLSILWELCFITESLFITLIPVYPLIVYLVMKNGYKYIRNRST
jgi:hypothetical protein